MKSAHGSFGIEGIFNAIAILFMKPPPKFTTSQEALRRRTMVNGEKQVKQGSEASKRVGMKKQEKSGRRRFLSSEHLDHTFSLVTSTLPYCETLVRDDLRAADTLASTMDQGFSSPPEHYMQFP
jgi:hypothetical protein